MAFLSISPDLTRVAVSLDRIARALEVIVFEQYGIELREIIDPNPQIQPEVSYTDSAKIDAWEASHTPDIPLPTITEDEDDTWQTPGTV